LYNITLDVPALIAHFNGPANLAAQLERHKLRPVSIKAIGKWIERGSIPGSGLIQLIALSDSMHRPINIRKFIKGAKRD